MAREFTIAHEAICAPKIIINGEPFLRKHHIEWSIAGMMKLKQSHEEATTFFCFHHNDDGRTGTKRPGGKDSQNVCRSQRDIGKQKEG